MTNNKWFSHCGSNGDIAVSTRVRLARNIENIPFGSKMTQGDCERLVKLCSQPILENAVTAGEFKLIDANELDAPEMFELVEAHLISPEFARSDRKRALLLSHDEGISLMINEEDHLRLQVIGSGLCGEECLSSALQIDSLIDEGLSHNRARYAYDENLGYLTRCPTNLGTGLRVSVMLHLPEIERGGGIERLTLQAGKLGLAVRGFYGEGSGGSGGLYQISNRLTLGYDEKELSNNLVQAVESIIEQEKLMREKTKEREPKKLEDKIYRAEAVLKSARLMTTAEAMNLFSDFRMGASMGIVDGDMLRLNSLLREVQPVSLAQTAKRKGLSLNTAVDRDAYRAEIIRNAMV